MSKPTIKPVTKKINKNCLEVLLPFKPDTNDFDYDRFGPINCSFIQAEFIRYRDTIKRSSPNMADNWSRMIALTKAIQILRAQIDSIKFKKESNQMSFQVKVKSEEHLKKCAEEIPEKFKQELKI